MKNKFIGRIAKFLILCLVLSSAPAFAADAAAPVSSQNTVNPFTIMSQGVYNEYVLGPGDTLELHIIVANNAVNLDYNLIISNAGTVFFPKIGEIWLSGLSIEKARERLIQKLSFSIDKPFKLYLILSKPRSVRVFFGSDEYMPAFEQINSYVFVYGEVSRPGRYSYLFGKKLSDYINMAGGPTSRSNLAYSTVTSKRDGHPKVYSVNAQEILYQGIATNDIEIKPGDIIKIPANWFYFSDFASFANTIMLAITLFYTVQTFIKK